MNKEVLIYDIECATNGATVQEIEKHKMKYFGAYSYKTDEFYFYNNVEDIQELINNHKILVGFNTKNYDNPILKQERIKLDYKIIIDLYHIMKSRAILIPHKKSFLSYELKSYSLKAITEELKLVTDDGKKDIDYKIFNIEDPTDEQIKEIKEYTMKDIEITKKLFEWVNQQFDGWKYHLSKKDQRNLKHISVAPSVYAYKVLANRCDFKEEYADIDEHQYQGAGGYVAYPAVEKIEHDIYCLDFASLYPHIMIQCNLYGRNQVDDIGWNGNGLFNINGYYNTDKMHKVSQVLMDIYKERKELKANGDPREHGLKITLNTCYGLLRNPVFKNVYDNVAGEDCCLLGQQWIKLAREFFKAEGYFIIYTDTDSVYIQDPHKDKDRILKVKEQIIKRIKENIPFPKDTFDMDIDYEIDMIHFFKGGNKKDESILDEDDIVNQQLGLMKKNYLFVYKKSDGTKDLYIKNLGIVKRTCSPLSKKIFWKLMVPEIIKTHNCKFEDNQIKEWINNYLQEDIYLISKRLTIQPKKVYKSASCIQAQAHDYIPEGSSERLGEGIHYLIPNKKMGFGKGITKYCTLDEYKEFLTIDDLYLNGIFRELRYFNINFKEANVKEIKFEDTLKQIELW